MSSYHRQHDGSEVAGGYKTYPKIDMLLLVAHLRSSVFDELNFLCTHMCQSLVSLVPPKTKSSFFQMVSHTPSFILLWATTIGFVACVASSLLGNWIQPVNASPGGVTYTVSTLVSGLNAPYCLYTVSSSHDVYVSEYNDHVVT